MRVLAIVFILACIVATPCSATPVLDQSQEEWDGIISELGTIPRENGQSFTVGKEGILSGISVYLQRGGDTPSDLTFGLFMGSEFPDEYSSSLINITIQASNISRYLHYQYFDLSSLNLAVAPNDTFLFILYGAYSPAQEYCVGYGFSSSDLYVGGTAKTRLNGGSWDDINSKFSDLVFRTYIDEEATSPPSVPEPSSLLLLAISSICLRFTLSSSRSRHPCRPSRQSRPRSR